MRWIHDDGTRAWHQWFAWYPVWIWSPTRLTNRRVWLEFVEREIENVQGWMIHRHRLPASQEDSQ